MGSGTTPLACLMHNRKFIGIDNDPKSFDTAAHRLINHSNNKL
jgi:DNA modification methylase